MVELDQLISFKLDGFAEPFRITYIRYDYNNVQKYCEVYCDININFKITSSLK